MTGKTAYSRTGGGLSLISRVMVVAPLLADIVQDLGEGDLVRRLIAGLGAGYSVFPG